MYGVSGVDGAGEVDVSSLSSGGPLCLLAKVINGRSWVLGLLELCYRVSAEADDPVPET